jgi:hypothetical protein
MAKERRSLDWIGLDWIGLDWIGLDWIGWTSGNKTCTKYSLTDITIRYQLRETDTDRRILLK